MRRRPNAEPGTGTQVHAFATPPDMDDRPNSMRINGTKWKVGHDYLDTEIGDVCELVEIVGRSSWCSTRDADRQPPKLVFEHERFGEDRDGRLRIDPNTPDFDEERFIERYTRSPPRGAPNPPW
jgi:hypothetical protein